MMEWDLGCSIDNLYEECESRFLETIGAELSKERKDVDNKKLYEAVGGGGSVTKKGGPTNPPTVTDVPTALDSD